ncbi:MAG: hypothetical protein DRP63_02250 [Planctomycetota bacterium]|nr:MAG: hypothetical protein DRP63_02250 [Planctomycetota bacterium]
MVRAFVATLFVALLGVADTSQTRDVIRRFLALPARKKAEVLAKWRLIKGMPKERRRRLIERLRRWLRERRCRRRALLVRWRRWRALRRRLLQQLPYQKRVALLRLPPWQRNAELAKIFNNHLLKVYRPLVYLFRKEQRKRLAALPRRRFLFEMRRLLRRHLSLACGMAQRSLPPRMREELERKKVRGIRLLAMRLPRHEKALGVLKKGRLLALLKHAPTTVRLVETELAWQRIKRGTAEHLSSYIATLPLQKRSAVVKRLLEEGKGVDGLPAELRDVALLPYEARREILLFIKRAPAPPRSPR